jgi:hypothetical protein
MIAEILLVVRLGERLVSPVLGVFPVDVSEEWHRPQVLNEV